MNDTAPHSSHAGRWIIAVVVTVVLYVVSAEPVTMSFWLRKGPWLPDSWGDYVFAFYRPAEWLWSQPPLDKFQGKWFDYWKCKLYAYPP